jgi:predicted RNase H-like nuclease
MATSNKTIVGVDACPIGWVATIIDNDGIRTETYEEFETLDGTHDDADRILVDIPIGLPEDERRQCDEGARDLLGSRGLSVFYPPCRSVIELESYEAANQKHREQIGHGLSQQAYSIGPKIMQVNAVVGEQYDGLVRESHPELCFAALNGQPIAYSKSSTRGRKLRMKLLEREFDDAEALCSEAHDEYLLKEVRRDDILDSMALAVAARDGNLTTVPSDPSSTEPRIYYPECDLPTLKE